MRLLIVDTTGIQPYIFGSNRLRENLGASHLVAQTTEEWALEILHTLPAVRSNVLTNHTLDDKLCIEESVHNLGAEVIYAGGGNIVILFRDEDKAREFTGKLSRKALTDAPNLQLVIAQQSFETHQSLFQAIKATLAKLAVLKRTRAVSSPLLGSSVPVLCRSTGLPASDVTQKIGDDEGYPASPEIHAKLNVATKSHSQPSEADRRLLQIISPPDQYEYPSDFSDLGGSKGEHSYIAVVHADGDGIGQRIMDIGKSHVASAQNRDYITALRRFSRAVDEAAQTALKKTLSKLINQITNGVIRHPTLPNLAIKLNAVRQSGKLFLPFRPIVFGGDDVTFVCDGRLGLSLAIEYLEQFEKQTADLPDKKGAATACSGIAIVKSHYPFARAYRLADGLCGSAKKYRREKNMNASCLDWHFAMSGLFGGIEKIRDREYKVSTGSLTLRPVALEANPKEFQRSWKVIHDGVNAFQGEGWAGRRNKVKALRDALRGGNETVKTFLTKFNEGQPLPVVCPSLTNMKEEGWQGAICGYFDAVEMIDWFIPL